MASTENSDDKPPVPSTPTTAVEYSRTISQDLRYLDDGLTHAIDQLTIFNTETMSDLSLKYELMRNNEVRIKYMFYFKVNFHFNYRVVLSVFLLVNYCYYK